MTSLTGRKRNLLGFIHQVEVLSPCYRHRWQTPFNVDRWPLGRFWVTTHIFGMPV